MALEGGAHPQHTGRAVGHLQRDAEAHSCGQFFEDGLLTAREAAQRLAAALREPVGQRTAAGERGRSKAQLTQHGADGPGRTLAEDRQPAAPAGKQLEHIPHDLRHVAVTGQKEMVQIAEYERRIEKFRHTVPLLSDAIKWVKYSGSSESKRRCSPVMGWMKPNVFAWRHWPWSLVMQLWGPYTGSPATGC